MTETASTPNLLKDDFELLDGYQAFSGEIVRLSLAVMGAFGAFLTLEKGFGEHIAENLARYPARPFCVFGFISLSLAISAALAHRYTSSGAMYYVLRQGRRPLNRKETRRMSRTFHTAELMILVAPITLCFGVIALGTAFVLAW